MINAGHFMASMWMKGFELHSLLACDALLTDIHFWCSLLHKIKEQKICLLR